MKQFLSEKVSSFMDISSIANKWMCSWVRWFDTLFYAVSFFEAENQIGNIRFVVIRYT